MKIVVLGTRAIPNIQGGVETHCEELYPRIVNLGHEVTVITRTPYVIDNNQIIYKGVKLKQIYAPKNKSFEAIIHTFLGVLYAGVKRPDILHIHAVGPMLLTPFAKLLGLKVIVTNHGPDYERIKWGKVAKIILKFGEFLGTKFANEVIVISKVIDSILKKEYNRQNSHLIYNGVNIPTIATQDDYITSLGLKKNKYIIAVGRFVEEKGFSDLIKAFRKIKTDTRLVLIGNADYETNYSKSLIEESLKAKVVLTGFIKGEKLKQIFSYAQLFVMPSYHEGLPIALLEAKGYNIDVLVSDIPANLEVCLKKNDYFKVGDIDDLCKSITKKLTERKTNIDNSMFNKKYNWDYIARQTNDIYKLIK